MMELYLYMQKFVVSCSELGPVLPILICILSKYCYYISWCCTIISWKSTHPLLFFSNFLYGFIVYSSQHPPYTELCVPNVAYVWSLHIWGKKFRVIHRWRLLQGSFAYTDISSVAHTASYTMVMWHGAVQNVIVPSDLDFKAAGGFIVHCCLCTYLLRVHWVTVMWHGCSFVVKNGNTRKSAPPPLFNGLVKCSTHRCSFVRLWL